MEQSVKPNPTPFGHFYNHNKRDMLSYGAFVITSSFSLIMIINKISFGGF